MGLSENPPPGQLDVVAPAPLEKGKPQHRFARGHDRPKGVKWFGAQSFWGHLRHLAAVAIATEDVDSRAWMSADAPNELMKRIAERLGAELAGSTLTECLARDLWIDYVADTGDDAAVSHAVARLIFAAYRLPAPDDAGGELLAPRGDILCFGGDTAYPVATAEEISNRVLVPFNRVLSSLPAERDRVLLGIPGNHDWYDGLDGFHRMFRRRQHDEHGRAPTSRDSTTLIGRYATYAREFVRGGQIEKPRFLDLIGYEPVQSASYFILPLAPGLTMLGVDRQLKRLDPRQQTYFADYLNTHLGIAPWVMLPDPLYAFGNPSSPGMEMLASLGLRLHQRPQFFLAGDIHHYRREQRGGALLVTAGGGGAFLHPAPLRDGELAPVAEWPDRAQSRALLWQVPFKVARGRSGILPHLVMLVALLPVYVGQLDLALMSRSGAGLVVGATLLLAVILTLLSGSARGRPGTMALASTSALGIVAFSLALTQTVAPLAALWPEVPPLCWRLVVLAVGVFGSVFAFGAYLALLTRFGLECTQAFTALDHPGFKHFLRLRVRKDGSAVDGYCIGLADPLSPACRPVLVDQFTFAPHRTERRP